jgi:hypothetical protein
MKQRSWTHFVRPNYISAAFRSLILDLARGSAVKGRMESRVTGRRTAQQAETARSGAGTPNQMLSSNAIGCAIHYSRSHKSVIRVYDAAGNVVETHEHKGDFKEP